MIGTDVAFQGTEGGAQVLIERKASARELQTNLFTPHRRKRFEAQLSRMREGWAFPVLLLEGKWDAFLKPTPNVDQPGSILDELLRLCLEHRISTHFIETGTLAKRRFAGELVTRLIWAGEMIDGRSHVTKHTGLESGKPPVGTPTTGLPNLRS